jgi:hypothetical protein
MKLEELAIEAEALPEEERATLAARLLHSLKSPHHYVSDEEVTRRMREGEADPAVMISYEELISGIRSNASAG